MTEAVGWAVLAPGGRLFVNSVSETRRASVINWLVTEKLQSITMYHTDDQIESMWKHFGAYVDCRQVTISDMRIASAVGKSGNAT